MGEERRVFLAPRKGLQLLPFPDAHNGPESLPATHNTYTSKEVAALLK